MRMLVAAAAAVAIVTAGPVAAQPAAAPDGVAAPPATLPPALDRVLRDYERAWRAGDGTALAALFTEDGFSVHNGGPIVRGRAAIAESLPRPGGDLQLTAYAFATAEGVGYIVGGYGYPGTEGPGGRFVLALRTGADGRWLIAADLDNAGPRRRD